MKGLIAGKSAAELVQSRGSLKAAPDVLQASLDGELSARHRLVLEAAHRHMTFLEEQIAALDRTLVAAMKPYEWAWKLLQTIPGLDQISAAMIQIEIGDQMNRFGSAARLASWPALCPGNNESAGKRKSGQIRRGNAIVRAFLCEVANAARRTKSVFRKKYEALALRRGHKRTIIALAHKLLRTIYVMLAHRQPYRDSGIDYEAMSVARNAPRWIKALKKFGRWPNAQPAST